MKNSSTSDAKSDANHSERTRRYPGSDAPTPTRLADVVERELDCLGRAPAARRRQLAWRLPLAHRPGGEGSEDHGGQPGARRQARDKDQS
jgi:hypothetical protein